MLKMGIYVDHENVRLSGGSDIDFEVLLEHLSNRFALIRASMYVVVDPDHAADLKDKLYRYRDKLRHIGYKVVEKEKRIFIDPETGDRSSKANTDMELAIDTLRELENLDVIVIVSGDGDFVRLVEAIQSRGRQVWVVAFDNVNKNLKDIADRYLQGFDIPNIRRVKPNNGYSRDDRDTFNYSGSYR